VILVFLLPGDVELDRTRDLYLEEQRELYCDDLYDIDWEKVRLGQCAGMPGKWVGGWVSGGAIVLFSISYGNALLSF